jgi:hypothetical protein
MWRGVCRHEDEIPLPPIASRAHRLVASINFCVSSNAVDHPTLLDIQNHLRALFYYYYLKRRNGD